jgi:cytochrome P450
MTACDAATDLPDGPRLSASETTFQWLARPYGFLDECAAKYGDTFTLRFTRFGTHVILTHPNDVRSVFAGDHHLLHAGRGNALLEPILGKHSLLMVDGDQHLAQRALLQPAFRYDRIQGYAQVIADATRRWTASWNGGATVSVQRTALEISKEVILRFVLGLADGELDEFSRLIHDVMVIVGTNATFDEQSDDPRLLQRFRSARGRLDSALQEQIERRRRQETSGDDVLSTLMAAHSAGGGALPDEEIRDQLLTMILAGHETTASSITWALLCLHAEPVALQKLEREIEEAGSELPDEQLASLSFLQAVCLETLRLRPVIPVVSRELQQPLRLGDKTLPPGVFVTPCAYLAHRRPESFPDPDTFRPERFLERRFPPYVYFPFGGGVRRCIGMSFALLEMQIVLGTLLRSFRFGLTEPVRPVRRAVTIVASGGGKMYVERRKAS